MKTEKSIELTSENVKEIQKDLLKFANFLDKGAKNAVEIATMAFYETVIKNCENFNITNHLNEIHWEYDKHSNIGKVFTNDMVILFNEIGTGIVGSSNPHPNPALAWEYDLNQHGESGWIYPKKDGGFGRTSGLQSRHMFQDAYNEVALQFSNIVNIELIKASKDLY